MRVVGKGNKERMIYLNDACREAIKKYLPVRAADPEIRDKDALFLSSRHTEDQQRDGAVGGLQVP